jgi:hypothetical protein
VEVRAYRFVGRNRLRQSNRQRVQYEPALLQAVKKLGHLRWSYLMSGQVLDLLKEDSARGDLHKPTSGQQRYPVGELGDLLTLMASQDNRHAQFAIQGAYESKDFGCTDRIELRGRLIEDEHPGLEGESRRDRQPLFLST